MGPGRRALLCTMAVVFGVAVSNGLKLPAYIIGCSGKDPKLNECALASAIDFFKTNISVTGDRKYYIPVLDPLVITQLKIDQPGLSIDYKNMHMYGLKDIQITGVSIDLKKLKAQYDFVIPHLKLVTKYTIKGQILVLPLAGTGLNNMTMTNIVGSLTHDFALGNTKKGKKHVSVVNTFLSSELGGFTTRMVGLFNGDKRLGDHINAFLNENWKDIVKEIKPSFNAALAQVADQILNNLAALVSYSEFFPEPTTT